MFSSRLLLPIACERLDDPPSVEAREEIERSNAAVLGFLLHGVDLEAMPRAADERLAEALTPLRTKLDMIIEMLGRLTYRGIELPRLGDIELGLAAITWSSPGPQQPGDWLRIKLYFDPTFREAVTVFGKVTSCTADNRDDGCRIRADLAEMPEGIGESVARLALLTQRRQRGQRLIRADARREN